MEENKQGLKKTLFSAIQPSGTITLGNYLGAIKNWTSLQEEFRCIFALADLHAITVRQEPSKFWNRLRKESVFYSKSCKQSLRACMDIKLLYSIWRAFKNDAI